MAKSANKEVHFHVDLSGIEKATIAAVAILVILIGAITWFSPQVYISTFGMFCELLGAILLGLGLTKTNTELLALTNHYETLHKQELISHLTRDRFFVICGIFLMALGILCQIIGTQFFAI